MKLEVYLVRWDWSTLLRQVGSCKNSASYVEERKENGEMIDLLNIRISTIEGQINSLYEESVSDDTKLERKDHACSDSIRSLVSAEFNELVASNPEFGHLYVRFQEWEKDWHRMQEQRYMKDESLLKRAQKYCDEKCLSFDVSRMGLEEQMGNLTTKVNQALGLAHDLARSMKGLQTVHESQVTVSAIFVNCCEEQKGRLQDIESYICHSYSR